MYRAKRWLFLVHRWLGIGVCAFFAMWFISGVVMMYVGYPKLTAAERLAHLPPLEPAAAYLPPRQALDAAGLTGPLKDLRLAAARAGRPVYLAVPAEASARRRPGAGTVVIDAMTGAVLRTTSAADALASAAAYAGSSTLPLRRDGVVNEDAFTHSRNLDAHRPLHVVQLDDAARTRLYISGTTGEVVRDAPRQEQLWNYAGAWIHWLYPFRGTLFDPWWDDIVNALSILGIAVGLSGTVVGVWRWRFTRAYKNGARSPYQGFIMRWHHITGLLFALVTLTWVFSGLMSMNPWRILDSGAPPLRTEALDGGTTGINPTAATPAALLAASPPGVRELRWVRAVGRDLVLARTAAGPAAVLDATSAQPRALTPAEVQTAASRLLPEPVLRVDRLTAYDLHYYSREAHTMTGGADKPLPALRVVFADRHNTWVHIDPSTGSVIGRTDDRRRLNRWLFAMLHSWDWLPLLDRRPLWDVLLITLSLGGCALSLTGVVIGWRRLGRKLRPARGA